MAVIVSEGDIAKVATLPLIGLAISTPKSGNLGLAILAMSGRQALTSRIWPLTRGDLVFRGTVAQQAAV
jgi:hypothetical protein